MIGNFTGETVPAEIDDAAGWSGAELLLTNLPGASSGSLTLAPWQAVVYKRTL